MKPGKRPGPAGRQPGRLATNEELRRLTAECYSRCLRTAMGILGNPDEARDATQTALCRAIEHLGTFEAHAQLSSWLTRIVINQCLMCMRRKKRWASVSVDSGGPGFSDLLFPATPSPEATIQKSELARLVWREAGRLPTMLREVIILCDLDERSIPEAAIELGVSVSAAKSRLLRARHELRTRLERCGVLRRAKNFDSIGRSTEQNYSLKL